MLGNELYSIYSFFKKLYHKSKGENISLKTSIRGKDISWGEHIRLHPYSTLIAGSGKIVMGNYVEICPHAKLICYEGEIYLGNNVGIQLFSILYGHGGLYIGNDVRIGAHTIVIPSNHIFEDPNLPIRCQGNRAFGIKIEDDVWVGANVSILDGVTIGKGSVIGAGSVVTTSIPPYSVAVGNPAKVIGKRN